MAATFITGATGFIGSEVLRRLLQRDRDREVHALVRAADDAEAARRGREVLFKLFFDDEAATDDARRRVHWIIGNLKAPGLGLAPEARERVVAECDELIHGAASTDWTLPLEAAEAVNVAGVKAIAALAAERARRPGGTRLLHISTAYVVGKRNGLVRADDLPGPDGPFNNSYEATKAQAERYLRERMGELPVTVVRPSIVVGDSTTGRTFNFNVIYFPIKLLQLGLLRVVPGRRSSTLDIVPVDYVADALLALGRDPAAAGRTFHLTADEDAMPLEAFLDRVVAVFAERRAALVRAGGAAPEIVRPRVAGPVQWALLRWWLRRTLGRQARRKFDAFETYLPYIFTDKRFVAEETRKALGTGVRCPPLASYLARVAEYAVTREWGREVSWDPALLRELA
jgi:long-chain acyl-CoA synthetase